MCRLEFGFALGVVVVAACANTEEAPAPRASASVDVSMGADAAAVDAASAASTEAAPSAAECAGSNGQLQAALGRAIVEARSGCSVDEDCVVVAADGGCVQECPVAIVASSQADFAQSLAHIAGELCAAHPPACPLYQPPPCTPVRATCNQGTCATLCDQPGWPDTTTGESNYMRTGASCGAITCPDLPELTDRRGEYTSSCCTEEGECGIFAFPLGPDCIARAEPGHPSAECPGVGLELFVDRGVGFTVNDHFSGCCRPDGACGFDTSLTWGAGCIARAAFARAALHTCTAENLHLGALETIECNYQTDAR